MRWELLLDRRYDFSLGIQVGLRNKVCSSLGFYSNFCFKVISENLVCVGNSRDCRCKHRMLARNRYRYFFIVQKCYPFRSWYERKSINQSISAHYSASIISRTAAEGPPVSKYPKLALEICYAFWLYAFWLIEDGAQAKWNGPTFDRSGDRLTRTRLQFLQAVRPSELDLQGSFLWKIPRPKSGRS